MEGLIYFIRFGNKLLIDAVVRCMSDSSINHLFIHVRLRTMHQKLKAMPNIHSLPAGSRPDKAVRNNGPDNLVLERSRLRELAEGWPMYRYSMSLV